MRRVRGVILGLAALCALATPAIAQPADFVADAKLFYRVVACAGSDPLPAGFDAGVVDAHCKDLARRVTRFKTRYTDPASAFIAFLRPAGLPTTVVYPFGGGDLVSALVTYPDLREVTTMSLEHPGDPTRLAKLTSKWRLREQLTTFRTVIGGLLQNSDSASVNMMKLERGPIPGQLGFFIVGLAVMGYEPTALHYFTLDENGGIKYLTQAEVDAQSKQMSKKKKWGWVDTDYSVAFTNMELKFRKAGDASAPELVHRHFAGNLANTHFKGSALEKHLLAKGKVSAMTKAASYLLWMQEFSTVRDYLLANMAFMVSDSTGIPPRHASKAGFDQIAYGRFMASYLNANAVDNAAFKKLWGKAVRKKLPFRYGYFDAQNNYHMLITAPAGTTVSAEGPPPPPKPVVEPTTKPAPTTKPKPAPVKPAPATQPSGATP